MTATSKWTFLTSNSGSLGSLIALHHHTVWVRELPSLARGGGGALGCASFPVRGRGWSSCLLCSPPDCPSDSRMDSPETLHVYMFSKMSCILISGYLQLTDSSFKDDLADSSARMVVRFHRLPITSFVTVRHEPDVLRLVRDPVPIQVEVKRLKWQIRTVLG